MLAYLDALCAALLSRNAIEIFRLLGLPDARKLPRIVREEAIAIGKAGPDSCKAPINALHLYYKLSHIVDETAELADEQNASQPASRRHRGKAPAYNPQMELSFRTRKVG